MPNWCYSEITIKDKKESIDTLYKELGNALSHHEIENSWGDSWIGNLLTHIGLSKEDILDRGKIHCRGQILDLQRASDNEIVFCEETAWEPAIRAVDKFIRNYSDTYKLYFACEESGNGVYLTNSPLYKGSYLVSIFEPDKVPGELNVFYEEEPVKASFLKDVLKHVLGYRDTDKVALDTLIEEALEIYSEYMSIEKFEYATVEEMN